MAPCSNYKEKRPFLAGVVVGFALCTFLYVPTYLYLGELRTQPLWHAALGKRLSQLTEVPTSAPNTTAAPTTPPGPVHPAPFNLTNPLSGYVNMLKDKEAFNMRCSVCALVSTSGHVLNYTAGAEIDQAECVIRMNHAPVEGYEKHVGTRTTVRVVTHSSFTYALKEITHIFSRQNRSKVVVWGPDDTMRIGGKAYNHLSRLTKESKGVEFYMLTPARMRYAHTLFDNETGIRTGRTGHEIFLSTGWFTMVLATEMCGQVKVYGMSNGDSCRDPNAYPAPYHYFASTHKNYRKECDEYKWMEGQAKLVHRFFAEKRVFEMWSKYHKISFHCPSWKPKG